MHDDSLERLLDLLANDTETAPPPDEDVLDGMVVEAAGLLSDLSAAADDLPGAAIWRQVADESGQPLAMGDLDGAPPFWFTGCADNEEERRGT
jgi:hypothetical protein